jgi:hypothetical protein
VSAKYNIICEQATTFALQFVVQTADTPWDLTGYTATMTVRPFVGSDETTILATTANGYITLGTTNGQVNVDFDSTLTAALDPTRYAYDFVFDSGSVITRLLEGKFIVTAGVTV